MPIELDRRSNADWVLVLSGSIDLFEARDLHALALEASTASSGSVVIRCLDVTSIDTSATQILLALKRTLAEDCRFVRFEDVPDAIAATWRRAGLGAEIVG